MTEVIRSTIWCKISFNYRNQDRIVLNSHWHLVRHYVKLNVLALVKRHLTTDINYPAKYKK